MLTPPYPENESKRVEALCGLGILDTPPEERFDRITRIARSHFRVSIALVSLVDSARQWFKSRQGLDAPETPRDISFCGHAILGDDVFYVPDALGDPRFADNPLVTGPPHIRFYAGAPLSGPDGSKVGTLCIIDTRSRTLSEEDFTVLRDLANCVEQELGQAQLQALASNLRAQESRLRAVLNTVIDGIITIDATGRIDTFNPAAERIFGYTSSEVIGEKVSMLMPRGGDGEQEGLLDRLLRTGQASVIGIGREGIGRRKDGSTFPVELSVGEMEVRGERMFTGIVRDITERKKISRMKSEFISTVSHELRTPLTSIQGALGLIKSGKVGELPEKLGRMLEIAHSNSGRLVRLINDILDSEKLAAGRMGFHLTPLELKPLLEQAIEANRAYGEQHRVRFALTDSVSHAMVEGDHDRLMQVLANLLSNAAKFSPEGSLVEIGLRPSHGGFRVSVTDRGTGIPEQFRDRIFQRFAQADSSDTRKKGGTGLGLSITRAIIEQLGGSIGFESSPGKGTTFFFDLPQLRVEAPAGGPPGENTPAARVLICEDNRDIAALLRLMLEQDGFETDIALTAREAKELLARHDYHAMTLDIGLPDQDGIALIREMRADPRTRNLPVVVVTADSVPGTAAHDASEYGIIDWITKPIDQPRLASKLREAIRSYEGNKPSILHVEDDTHVARIITEMVGDLATVFGATTLAAARELLNRRTFDLVILDLSLPDGNGESLLPLLKGQSEKSTPVIVFSGKDVSGEAIRYIRAALVKSQTTNEALLAAIRASIRPHQPEQGTPVREPGGTR